MPEWLEVAIRTFAAVMILFLLTKLLGKRQVSQLSLFEYITGISIGSIAATMSLDLKSTWYMGIISLVVWAAVSLLFEYLPMKSKFVRDLVGGKGTILIQEGKILEDNLTKEKLTADELLERLRSKNAFSASDVEFAVMEPSGEINILLKKENQPLTSKHLGLQVAPERESQTVIIDGVIMDDPLANAGFNRGWLDAELEKLGVALENVFLGQVDSYGQLYVDLYDDQIQVAEPQLKASVLATLKKCEADIEKFSLSTNNPESKRLYDDCSKQLQQIIKEVRPLLSR